MDNGEPHYHHGMINARMLLETWELLGKKPLPRGLARQVLSLPKEESLDDWFAALPDHASDRADAEQLVALLRQRVADPGPSCATAGLSSSAATGSGKAENTAGRASSGTHVPDSNATRPPASLTFAHTARRSFEKTYWKTIARLASGRYANKDNADCVQDPLTQSRLAHHRRDLELGDFLIAHYQREVERAGMAGRALVGELPFRWRTDFHFPWWGGWAKNQEEARRTRFVGRHSRPEPPSGDRHGRPLRHGLHGRRFRLHAWRRRAAAGGGRRRRQSLGHRGLDVGCPDLPRTFPPRQARPRHLAAPSHRRRVSRRLHGRPSLCERLVQGTLRLRLPDRRWRDLADASRGGLRLDMIAHNSDRDRDVFQMCPGHGPESLWLAEQRPRPRPPGTNRRRLESPHGPPGRGRRSAARSDLAQGRRILQLHGEVRRVDNPRSTLYNTDGQIFSDAGVPVVLFMENYDINRHGYHDSQDTMANIDLDYGAAVAAIAVESVARAATEEIKA